jgi:hypothetical protein
LLQSSARRLAIDQGLLYGGRFALTRLTMHPVEIRIKGCLDPHWTEWLGGLSITHSGEDQTLLSGQLADQAALFGLIARLRDLGLEVIYLKYGVGEGMDEA